MNSQNRHINIFMWENNKSVVGRDQQNLNLELATEGQEYGEPSQMALSGREFDSDDPEPTWEELANDERLSEGRALGDVDWTELKLLKFRDSI